MVAAVYVIFWPVSDLIARHDVGAITRRGYGTALQAAWDAARGRLVAFGVGLFAAGALIYTARNFSLARQGQVIDRYTKAIEQLGSDKGLDVQIGGIYALERIARDSPRDHPTIMEVLAAFIRDHSSEQWPPAEPGAEGTPERLIRPDVQAAVRVVARRDAQTSRSCLWTSLATAFTRATLTVKAGEELHLRRASDGARPQRADLTGAHLDGAHLDGAHLDGAHLDGAHLTLADLTGARWREGAQVPEGWMVDGDSGRLKRAGELSEVTVHYL